MSSSQIVTKRSRMNKLHNFKFIGEFPVFECQDEEGSFINDAAIELNILCQDMYLPPFDNSKAYYDFTGNFPGDFTTYNLRFLEGYETTSTGNILDEIDIDSISTELIFLENFEKELGTAVFSDITLQDIFLDQQIMPVKERNGKEKACFSDIISGESENNVINLYYMSEKPSRENRKVKSSSNFEREKYFTKKRRTL